MKMDETEKLVIKLVLQQRNVSKAVDAEKRQQLLGSIETLLGVLCQMHVGRVYEFRDFTDWLFLIYSENGRDDAAAYLNKKTGGIYFYDYNTR